MEEMRKGMKEEKGNKWKQKQKAENEEKWIKRRCTRRGGTKTHAKKDEKVEKNGRRRSKMMS